MRSSLRILTNVGELVVELRGEGVALPSVSLDAGEEARAFGGGIEVEGTGGSFPVRARIGFHGRSRPMAEAREVFVQQAAPTDVLLVLDRSSGTIFVRRRLAGHLERFLAAAAGSDGRVGVIRSDVADGGQLLSAPPDGLSSREGPLDTRVVTAESMPSPADALRANLNAPERGASAPRSTSSRWRSGPSLSICSAPATSASGDPTRTSRWGC